MRPQLLLMLLLLLPLLALASASQPWTSARRDAPIDNRRETVTVCDIRCCRTQPNCWHATSVTCDCRNTNQMTLQSGFFPDTVRNVTIAHVQNIVIAEGAIARLHQLEQLIIDTSGTVHVQTHGLQQHEDNRLRLLRILGASSVTIDESAFSGQWNADTGVYISAVSRVTVGRHGFRHSSDSSGPDLSFYYVKLLRLSPAAIAAPIFTLHMWNVHMDVCHEDSVGGGHVSRSMLFENSSISVANAGCVKDVKSLIITSTSFTSIQNGAFLGKFTEVRITNSTMTSVQKGGFRIEVESFHVHNSQIDTLESRGLAVQAKDSILLNQVTVRLMKQYALFGLTRVSTTASWPAIRIHGLNITQQAYNGSLAFAADAPVELVDLTVAPRRPPVCPTELWTRQVTGNAAGGHFTVIQSQVYNQLARSQPCADENRPRTEDPDSRDDTDRTPPPVDATVVPGEERAAPHPPPEPASRGDTVTGPVLYSVLGAIGALAVAVAACLLVRRHRRRAAVAADARGGKQPLDARSEDGDYAEIPTAYDYAEPVAGRQTDGDYAEVPAAYDYAEPGSATASSESQFGEYVLMLHRRRPEGPAGAQTSLYANVAPSPAEDAAPAER